MIKTCLFVNSDPEDQYTFITALSEVAPETLCLIAPDGCEALEVLKDESVVPDCIFVELSMPGVDGMSFLAEIKSIESLRKVPVIIHCENQDPLQIIALKELGAFAIYFRPYDHWGMCNLLHLYMRDNVKTIMN